MTELFRTTVQLSTPEGDLVDVEIEAKVGAAEPDVGIMGDWIDEWWISAVGHDSNPTPELKEQAEGWLKEEYGDDTAIAEWLGEQLD